jgi:hypothetical protein
VPPAVVKKIVYPLSYHKPISIKVVVFLSAWKAG